MLEEAQDAPALMDELIADIETSLEAEAGITVDVLGVTVQDVAVAPTPEPTPEPTPQPTAAAKTKPKPKPYTRERDIESFGIMSFGFAIVVFVIISVVLYLNSRYQGAVLKTVSAQAQGVQKTKSQQFASLGPFKDIESNVAPVGSKEGPEIFPQPVVPDDVSPVNRPAPEQASDVAPTMLVTDDGSVSPAAPATIQAPEVETEGRTVLCGQGSCNQPCSGDFKWAPSRILI
jgi:hypothetical protein